jgi:Holliday junction resolvase RusA-like endonuclease
MKFSIEYDHMPHKDLRGNSRAHWAAKIKPKKDLQVETMIKLREVGAMPMSKVKIRYIVYYCGRPIDADNLIMGMKHAQDMLAIEGIIEDDNPYYVKEIATEYHQVKTRKEVKLIMEVTEIED